LLVLQQEKCSYGHQDVCLGVNRKNGMRYGKNKLSFVRVAIVTPDSKVIAGFTNSCLQHQRY